MKNRYSFFFALLLAAFLSACSKEEAEPLSGTDESLREVTVTLRSPQGKTEVEDEGGFTLHWSSGDKVSWFSSTDGGASWGTANTASISSDGRFTVMVGSSADIRVIYPPVASGGTIPDFESLTVPSDQVSLEGGAFNPANYCMTSSLSIGPSDNKVDAVYTTVGTLLRLDAVGSYEQIVEKVSVQKWGESSLEATYNLSLPDEVRLGPSPVSFYIVLPTGKYRYAPRLTLSDGRVYTASHTANARNFNPNTLIVAALDCVSAVPDPDSFIEEPDDASATPSGVFDYSVLENVHHPRLLMNAADFAAIQRKVNLAPAGNSLLVKAHRLAINLADAEIAAGKIISHTMDDDIRMLSQSRAALQRLFACAYAWRTTGQSKYLDQVVTDLNNVCSSASFPDWNLVKHHLDAGEMALGVAIAYDWCYYSLPYATRVAVHRALMDNALTPGKSNNFRESTNNHNQVCYAGYTAAALALYEKEKAEAAFWLDDLAEKNKAAQIDAYSPDGNYAEGAGYWTYGTSFECFTLAMLDKIFGNTAGLADVEGFDKTGEWILFTTGGDTFSSPFNYMDYMGTGEFGVMYPLWWMADYFNAPELLVYEVRKLDSGTFAGERLTPLLPCLLNNISVDLTSLSRPSSQVWSGNGSQPVILVHTDWTNSVTDKYLGIKGGTANADHGHMDAGSFVYDAFGLRWVEDLGAQGYSNLESIFSAMGGNFWSYAQDSYRWKVYNLNNFGHSTLSVNSALHKASGSADIQSVYSSGPYLGGKLNMSTVLSDNLSGATRDFRLQGDELAITDVVTTKFSSAATIRFQIITGASASIEDGIIVLRKGGKVMNLYATVDGLVASPEYFIEAARGSESWDSANTGMNCVGFTVSIPRKWFSTTTATITTYITPVTPTLPNVPGKWENENGANFNI